MCRNSLSSIVFFEAFQENLSPSISTARSLDEIEAYIKLQRCVESVQLSDYLLKTNPPQRDFIVGFRMDDRSTVIKTINIFDLGNGQYRFHKLRDR